MNIKPVCTGVVGAGMISEVYLENMINEFSILHVKAIGSARGDSAEKRAKQFGIQAMSVEEMLADPEIELIVNLTPVQHHETLIRKALTAGKHVYTEKTLTDRLESAKELIYLAKQKNLYLGSAPDTFLGASWQTARKVIDEGEIGRVTSVMVSANRQNDIMLSFYPFLRAPGCGAAYDYGVYYITALVSMLGPIAQAAAIVDNPIPSHINRNPESPEYQKEFICENESRISAILQFESGITGTFMLNANSIRKDQSCFMIYGTDGILCLGNPDKFGEAVKVIKNKPDDVKKTVEKIVPFVVPYEKNSRGIGAADMAYAIRKGKENRASADMAYHVLDVLSTMLKSGETGEFQKISSRCRIPRPLNSSSIIEK